MKSHSQLKNICISATLFFFMLFSFNHAAQARVLSGSVTEKKLAKAITRLLKKARKNYDKNKVQQAIDTYWKILEISPETTIAYLELGYIYIDLQIYDRAIELFEPGLEMAKEEMLEPEVICEYFCLLTNAYIELGQMGHASKSLIKAAQNDPKHPLPRKILGDIYLSKNRIKDAIKAYKKAVQLDPDFQPAQEKLAELADKHSALYIASTAKKKKKISKKKSTPSTQIAKVKTQPKASPRPVPIPMPAPSLIAKKKAEPKPASTPKPIAKTKAESKPTSRPLPNRPTAIANKTQVTKTPAKASPNKEFIDPEREAELKQQKQEEALIDSSLEANIDKLLIGNPEEKEEALELLIELKEKGIEAIEDLLYDSDPDVRIIAVRSLAKFKDHKDKIKEIIKDSQDDPDEDVKEAIKSALIELE
eukprot:Anaeramoba_ignava/a619263_22.p1 GENE.a619263_22~~a619263_22.p1  ORF type:complete len:421 (-),score=40.81 a619263_22:21-1283(-)